MAGSKTKKTKAQRIKSEYDRLEKIFKEFPEESLSMVEGLLKRAAFMRIELEDMEESLIEKGQVEMFSQSDKQQPYERERPTARMYNTMNKNYQTIIKDLSAHLPKVTKEERVENFEDAFQGFIRRKEDE